MRLSSVLVLAACLVLAGCGDDNAAPTTSAEPSVEALTVEPSAPATGAQPQATTDPAQPTATAAPSEPAATAAPSQPKATTAPSEPTASEEPSVLPGMASKSTALGEILTGTLGGDAALEGGCTWLEFEGERVQVVYPDGYRATADPLELTGPDGTVIARGGDKVTVTGAPDPGMATFCQVGPVFTADMVETTGSAG